MGEVSGGNAIMTFNKNTLTASYHWLKNLKYATKIHIKNKILNDSVGIMVGTVLSEKWTFQITLTFVEHTVWHFW